MESRKEGLCLAAKRSLDLFLVFCRPGVSLTMQAFSEEERKQWLEALGGKEAVRITSGQVLFLVLAQ